jgi:hypothetical protein
MHGLHHLMEAVYRYLKTDKRMIGTSEESGKFLEYSLHNVDGGGGALNISFPVYQPKS